LSLVGPNILLSTLFSLILWYSLLCAVVWRLSFDQKYLLVLWTPVLIWLKR
jgi:hypothetical protein